jgi:hypothetical protein
MKEEIISICLFFFGLGLYIHDRITEWEVLGNRLHGLDVGIVFIMIAWVILIIDFFRWVMLVSQSDNAYKSESCYS